MSIHRAVRELENWVVIYHRANSDQSESQENQTDRLECQDENLVVKRVHRVDYE